jgi:hypothetical protein
MERGTDTGSATDDTFCSHQSTPRFMEIGCAEAVKRTRNNLGQQPTKREIIIVLIASVIE